MQRLSRRSEHGVSRRSFIRKAAAGAGTVASGDADQQPRPAPPPPPDIRVPAEFASWTPVGRSDLQFPMTGAQPFARACKEEGVAALLLSGQLRGDSRNCQHRHPGVFGASRRRHDACRRQSGAIGPMSATLWGSPRRWRSASGPQLAHKGSPVVCITGDAGFGYTAWEMETLSTMLGKIEAFVHVVPPLRVGGEERRTKSGTDGTTEQVTEYGTSRGRC
jgi:hypothetical protein